MGLLPTKHINTKGDATDNTVSDIASCENQIHPFFPHQKIGHLLKRSPPTAAIHKYQHRSRRVARIPQVMKAEVGFRVALCLPGMAKGKSCRTAA
jgi:hypothetical protein